jgi:AcrR family transcriptional regulator
VQAAVLQATEELLDEGHSYANLKVEQIATRAGIGRTAFYFYFRDKRELLMHLTESLVTELYEHAERFWQADPADGIGEIAEVLQENITIYLKHASVLRAITEMAAVDEVVCEFWRGMVRRFIEANAQRIDADREAGRSSVEHPVETAFVLMWATERSLNVWSRANPEGDPTPIIEALVAVWQRTLFGSLPGQK